MQLELGLELARELRRGAWPKNRRHKAAIGCEYMRAAADGRPPAPWARAALRRRRALTSAG